MNVEEPREELTRTTAVLTNYAHYSCTDQWPHRATAPQSRPPAPSTARGTRRHIWSIWLVYLPPDPRSRKRPLTAVACTRPTRYRMSHIRRVFTPEHGERQTTGPRSRVWHQSVTSRALANVEVAHHLRRRGIPNVVDFHQVRVEGPLLAVWAILDDQLRSVVVDVGQFL